MRRSRVREIILEELKKTSSHPRGDELYHIVRKRLPRVSLGTIYRNLQLFCQQRLALELGCGDFKRYDGNTSPHSHFLCLNCHCLWDWQEELEAPTMKPPVSKGGFQVYGQFLFFLGLCPECSVLTGRFEKFA